MRVVTACLMAVLLAHESQAGVTLYVSRLGDNSDGQSWTTAYRTVQGALDALPDAQGGHRIIMRPDTYLEANLFPAQKGAPGAYNEFIADFDGSRGSGASGYAVIDSSDPERGLKSVDWWGPFRSSPDFSAIGWDRWHLQHIYVTGGDGGLFWDFPPKIEQFSIVVEDSVGIGRAFGGGVGHMLPRADEPVVFRRCQLWCLDWWGDASGAYVRAENETLQTAPDVTFEECTLVGPDNALQAGNPGYAGYSRMKLKGCRLVSLNFSQPRGKPGSGIIYSTIKGELLHVDIEDCTLMGYKVFGAGEGEVSYSVAGSVQAYVQYEQDMPKDIQRLGSWPVEIFQQIIPPMPPTVRPQLTREPRIREDICEVSPVVWNGRLCLMECERPASGGERNQYYLRLLDAETREELARFGEGHGLACAFVHDDTFYAFASRFENADWNDVTCFSSRDLKTWEQAVVVKQDPDEHLFNSSVCASPDGFTMAYETNDPDYPAFTIKFAASSGLKTWNKSDAIFGTDRYTACPALRYAGGHYYLFYTEHLRPRWFFETWLARSPDLKQWTLSPHNPVLTPTGTDECIDASDPDLVEWQGKTYLYYCVGDQRTWMDLKRAWTPGPMDAFLAQWF